MTDFSTVASMKVALDDRSVKDSRDTLESELGNVLVRPELERGVATGLRNQLTSEISPVPVDIEPQVSGGVTGINAAELGGVADGGNLVSTTAAAGAGATLGGGNVSDQLAEQTGYLESMAEMGEQRNDYLESIDDAVGLGGGGGGGGGLLGGAGGMLTDYLLYRSGRGGGGSGLINKLLSPRALKLAGAGTIVGKTLWDLNEARDDIKKGDRPAAAEEIGESMSTGTFGLAGWLAGGPIGGALASVLGEPAYDAAGDVLRDTWSSNLQTRNERRTNLYGDQNGPNPSAGPLAWSPTSPALTGVRSALQWQNMNVPDTSDLSSQTPAPGVADTSQEALQASQSAQQTGTKAINTAKSIQNMNVSVNLGGVNVQNQTSPKQVKDEVKRQINAELDAQLDRILRQFLNTTGAGIVSAAQETKFESGF